MNSRIERSELFFFATLICGASIQLFSVIFFRIGLQNETIALTSGIAVALTSIRFYEALVLFLVSKGPSPYHVMMIGTLKLLSLGVFFLLVFGGTLQTIIFATLGLLSLVPGALATCFSKKN